MNNHHPFLFVSTSSVLTIASAGHALHVFINGQLSGTAYGTLDKPKLTFSQGVNLRAGVNKISIRDMEYGRSRPCFTHWS
ncbi:hypothetical protein ACS0TY_005977 [Phlomoides rotata]